MQDHMNACKVECGPDLSVKGRIVYASLWKGGAVVVDGEYDGELVDVLLPPLIGHASHQPVPG